MAESNTDENTFQNFMELAAKTIVSFGILILLALPAVTEEFVDDFSGAELKGRQAERGDWQFRDGVASCASDPVLYKQFKNTGRS